MRRERVDAPDLIAALRSARFVLAVWRLFPDGRTSILQWNDHAQRVLGYSEHELAGRDFLEFLIPPEDIPGLKVMAHRLASGEPVQNNVNSCIAADGRHVLLNWFNALCGSDEHGLTVLSIASEITNEQNSVEEQRFRDQIFRLALEAAPIYVGAQDAELRYLWVHKLLPGYTRASLIGRSDADVWGGEDAARLTVVKRRAIETRQPVQERVAVTVAGSRRCFDLTVEPLGDPAGPVTGIAWAATDITDLARAEERARDGEGAMRAALLQNRLLSQAVEQSLTAFVITDTRGTIEYVNEAFERMTGYSREELLGHDTRMLQSGRTQRDTYEAMWATLLRGESSTVDFINRRKDGRIYTQSTVISPVRDESGRTISYVASSRDVTGERELAQQLRQSQKMEAVGQLTGGVAHDFNNLLSVITTNTDLLIELCPPEMAQLREVMDDIRRAARSGTELVKKLLGFSRTASIEMQIVDLNDTVRAASAMLRRLIPESVVITATPHEAPVYANVDTAAVEQMLLNLATNARDAMPAGGTLTIQVLPREVSEALASDHAGLRVGRYAAIAVRDSGAGMAPDVVSRIFEPFFTTKPSGFGTGLGLAMVYGLIKQHGGYIMVDSAVNAGTTMTLLFPLVARASRPSPSSHAVDASLKGGTETVLLVEDQEPVRRTASRILTRFGYTVVEAADGAEALSMFLTHTGRFHVVVADLIMPRMNGIEMARSIRLSGHNIPIVLATGYTSREVRETADLPPDIRIIEKPWSLPTLLQAVRQALDGP